MSRRKAAFKAEDINVSEERKSFIRSEKRSLISILFSSSKRVFILCLVMRMINSLLVQTYFNPDEHWQALEVAHRITFGYNVSSQILLKTVSINFNVYLKVLMCSC